jgi:hypothetical protein
MGGIIMSIEEYDGELPEGFNETLEDVKIATKRINDVLKDYNISVVMSSLSSAVVQAICLTSNDLAEAQTTAANLSVFLSLAIDNADDQGICGWNQTRQ